MRSTPSYYREQIDGPQPTPGDQLVAADAHHAAGAHHGIAHVVPPSILIGVFSALMVLTIATVAVTKIDLGYNVNLIVALGIAVVKAVLVIAYFMHLRYDSPMYTVLVGLCLIFIGVFIGFTTLDTGNYAPILDATQVTPAP
ncbi:MAG TPA: cytochrome C oxidase subunit IV family protein [Tepidisphaeraceae bacterium]|jgi:cytochrome c oxidase subunit 4